MIKKVTYLAFIIFNVFLLASLQGCSGVEIGTKAWLTRVDTHEESSKTLNKPMGLRCMFTDCDHAYKAEEQGS